MRMSNYYVIICQLQLSTQDSASTVTIPWISEPNALIICCIPKIQFCFTIKFLTDILKLSQKWGIGQECLWDAL